MYTSKCVIQNCYIKLLFKYLKVQGLTNVCVFDLFALWLHFKFGRTLIETWYTHVQLRGRSAYLHIKLFLIDLHSNILQQFTYEPCIFVHYFKITWVVLFLFFKSFLVFCVSGWIWDTTHIHVEIVFAEVNADRNIHWHYYVISFWVLGCI